MINFITSAAHPPLPRGRMAFFIALFLLYAHSANAIELGLPARCAVGKTCFIQNYPDHDPSRDFKDYQCGTTLGYNTHDGTDIRLIDLDTMRQGVDVLAVADGVVLATRDGMDDINVRQVDPKTIKNRECGNGVVIRHADNLDSQVCHMKKGSIIVKQGQTVKAGDKLGEIGLSGQTEFPHVHLTVRTSDTAQRLDPFTGKALSEACSKTPDLSHSLWRKDLATQMRYERGNILAYGFTDHEPNIETINEGEDTTLILSNTSPIIAFWVHLYGVEKKDELVFTLSDANKHELAKRNVTSKSNKAVYIQFIGRKLAQGQTTWPSGNYTGELLWKRDGTTYRTLTQPLLVQ